MITELNRFIESTVLRNNAIDEEIRAVEARAWEKETRKYCGEMADIYLDPQKAHKSVKNKIGKETEQISKTKIHKGNYSRAFTKEKYEQPITEDEMKRRLRMFAKSHGLKVINASQYKKQQEMKMQENVASATKNIKRELIEKIENDKSEPLQKPAVLGMASKKTIEKAKTAYLDSFSKEVGEIPKAKEITKQRISGLRHQKSSGREGRQ